MGLTLGKTEPGSPVRNRMKIPHRIPGKITNLRIHDLPGVFGHPALNLCNLFVCKILPTEFVLCKLGKNLGIGFVESTTILKDRGFDFNFVRNLVAEHHQKAVDCVVGIVGDTSLDVVGQIGFVAKGDVAVEGNVGVGEDSGRHF